MSLIKMTDELDKALIKEWQAYNDLHKKFNEYRGKELDKEKDVPRLNSILKEIQDKFKEIARVFYFVQSRHQQSIIAAHEFQLFIGDIKKAGGFELPEEKKGPDVN